MPVMSFTTGNCARSGVTTNRFTGGTANSWQRNPLQNRLRWGSDYASIPVGWREGALTLPFKDGGIRLRLEGSSSFAADVPGYGEVAMSLSGSSLFDVPGLGLTGLRDLALTLTGTSSLSITLAAFGDLVLAMRVGELSQQDVEGAVMEAVIENGFTLRDAIRLLLAIGVGKTSVSGSTATFRDTADTKDRVVGTVVGGERTTVTLDPS